MRYTRYYTRYPNDLHNLRAVLGASMDQLTQRIRVSVESIRAYERTGAAPLYYIHALLDLIESRANGTSFVSKRRRSRKRPRLFRYYPDRLGNLQPIGTPPAEAGAMWIAETVNSDRWAVFIRLPSGSSRLVRYETHRL